MTENPNPSKLDMIRLGVSRLNGLPIQSFGTMHNGNAPFSLHAVDVPGGMLVVVSTFNVSSNSNGVAHSTIVPTTQFVPLPDDLSPFLARAVLRSVSEALGYEVPEALDPETLPQMFTDLSLLSSFRRVEKTLHEATIALALSIANRKYDYRDYAILPGRIHAMRDRDAEQVSEQLANNYSKESGYLMILQAAADLIEHYYSTIQTLREQLAALTKSEEQRNYVHRSTFVSLAKLRLQAIAASKALMTDLTQPDSAATAQQAVLDLASKCLDFSNKVRTLGTDTIGSLWEQDLPAAPPSLAQVDAQHRFRKILDRAASLYDSDEAGKVIEFIRGCLEPPQARAPVADTIIEVDLTYLPATEQ